MQVNIVLSGVGGQGILTLASVLGSAAIINGFDVRISEVHGMAQRGGSVICHVKYGRKVASPLVMKRMADIIISLEASETLKSLNYLKPGGTIIMSTSQFPPPLSTIKGLRYPNLNEIFDDIKSVAGEVYIVNANEIARKIGSILTANMVVLGSAWSTGKLHLTRESIIKSINMNFKEHIAAMNIKAFEEGIKAVKKLL